MISKKQLAIELSVSVPTIDRWLKQGMPCHKLNGRMVRFKLEECIEWLERKEQNAKRINIG